MDNVYKFRKGDEPEPQLQPVEPETAPYPENEGAITVEQYYQMNPPPQKRPEFEVRHKDEDGWTWVKWPRSASGRCWPAWRFGMANPEYLFIVPIVVDTRQPVAQMRDPL